MFYVYAISSRYKEYIYVGFTENLYDRIQRHNNGYERTTKSFAPFNLIFKEKCENRSEARRREKYWKSGCGKEQLKIIKNKNNGQSIES